MSSVAVIRRLLVADAALTAVVTSARIFAGDVPLNTALPAIGVSDVTAIPRNTVSMKEVNRVAKARVQVTVYAASYPSQKTTLDLVRKALPNTFGMVGATRVLSVLPDTISADMKLDEPQIFIQSRDFKVTYIE